MAMTESIQFQPASDQSLLVYFGQQVTLDAHLCLRKLLRLLELKPVPGIRNLHPAYCSLLVDFDALKLRHAELEAILRSYLGRLKMLRLPNPRQRRIPTCYGGEFGPDLNEVAALRGITPAQAVELHASVTYVVCFLGFVPGFAYLGGLPEALVTPRLTSPRRSTPPGSGGIAGNQTGVYPLAAPERENMSFLSIGDRVRFTPISVARFATLENA
jgi:KipI family sensor histidine kinase inhibitor